MLVKKIDTYTAFWKEIVTRDFNEFGNNPDDIRLAFHLAISLFHMADWVYGSNKAYINSHFTFRDKNGVSQPVSDEKMFANALRDINRNFELIRSIANAAKHLEIRDPAKAKTHHPHAPSHAANTATRTTSYGTGPYGAGPYGGTARVKKLWLQKAADHGWTL